MQAVSKISPQKIILLILGLSASLIAIAVRLAYLQIHLNEQLQHQSQKNFLRFETVRPPRGNIIDSKGVLLATNRPVHNVCWLGSGSQTITPEQRTALAHLGAIINQDILENKELLVEISRAERHQKKVVLARDVDFETLCQLEELFPQQECITIETEFQRFYPHSTCASHVLGYLGNMRLEPTGKMGIEQIFEAELKGTHGIKQKTINSLGRSLTIETLQEALAGNDIQTTLDLSIQKIVESIFPTEYSGTCIIMKPDDGSLVAMVSRPNFDPNTFLTPILAQDWHNMQEEQLFVNRAFNASYPPGSIFKLVTASAALEEQLITRDTCWNCRGYIMFSNRKYLCQCRKSFGYEGELSSKQALARSCNTFFYEIGKKISIDTLAGYAHTFGLGSKTAQHFPEKSGLVPTSRWKMQTKGERWWPGETLSTTIGQSFLLVTPIQIARMIGSIFTGYLVTPRIIATEPVQKQPLCITATTRDFLQESMKATITHGTGQRSRIKEIEIYAKTSTAQTSGLDKRELGTQYWEHGWFVAYVKYKEYEPLVLVILVERAGTARIPTVIAKQFLLEYKRHMDTQHA